MKDPTGHEVSYDPGEPPEDDMLRDMHDLAAYFDTNGTTLGELNRQLYKTTECGAHISVIEPNGTWHHNGEDSWTGDIAGFRVGSIVEGSDVEIDSDIVMLPASLAELLAVIQGVELGATLAWHEANDTGLFECGLCGEVVCNHDMADHSEVHAADTDAQTWERIDAP